MSPPPPTCMQPLLDLVEQVKDAWRTGTPPDARKVLEENSELLQHRSLVVELVYEEYCVREEHGFHPDPDAFCKQFPVYQSYIREVIRGHRLLADNPDLFQQSPRWPEKGDTFEGLLLLQELGRGAFARVYLAQDPDTGNRPVVLKLSPARSSEAKTLGVITHDHIVGVYWSRQANDFHGVCMPYVGSTTLADAISRAFQPDAPKPRSASALISEPTVPEAPSRHPERGLLRGTECYGEAIARVAARIADALAYLHQRNITHGDLKPSNILLGKGGHPYLIDFNLSTSLENRLPVVGGTLPYMAPERLQAMLGLQAGVVDDPKADVYAFAMTLLEAWTGQVPIPPDPIFSPQASARDLLSRRLAMHESELCSHAEIPFALRRMLESCLSIDPDRRPTMSEIHRGLTHYCTRRRRRWTQTLYLLVLLAGFASAGWSFAPGTQQVREVEVHLSEPKTPEDLLARGVKQLQLGQAGPALSNLSRAMQMKPSGLTIGLMGYAEGASNRHTVAMKLYQESAEKYGCSEFWIHNNWAYHLLKSNQHACQMQAFQQASKAVELNPKSIAGRLNRAIATALLNMNRKSTRDWNQQALDDVALIVQQSAGNAQLHYDLSFCYLHLLEDSGECQRRAIHSLCESRRLGMPFNRIENNPLFYKLDRLADSYQQIFSIEPDFQFTLENDENRIARPW